MNDRSQGRHRDIEVLVVGAGPTGLTLACDLVRRGVRVRVVERALESPGSRGKALQPRTLEVFDDLGVLDRVLGEGCEYPPMRIHAGFFAFPWDLVKRERTTDRVPHPNLWMLPQTRTEAILRARFEELGGSVETGAEFVDLEQDGESVAATLSSGGRRQILRARYLVGADGGHSFVRKRVGIPFSGERTDLAPAVVGDVRVAGLDRRFWHAWPLAKGGPVALCPLPGGDLFQLFAQMDESTPCAALDVPSVGEFVRRSTGEASLAINGATWLSLYRPNIRLADRYREGRVFLAGDAAHVHPPTGGQGLNAGVQDAYNLGWKLAAVLGGADASLLGTYEEERRAVAAGILELSTATYRAKWRTRGADTKQLRTGYRDSTIAWERRARPGRIRAGDRAPDARGTDRTGRAYRFFDVFRGPQATLLAFGANPIPPATATCRRRGVKIVHVTRAPHDGEAATFIDPRGEARRSYGAGDDTLVLVRPDGYVGFACDGPAASSLASYLQKIAPDAGNAPA